VAEVERAVGEDPSRKRRVSEKVVKLITSAAAQFVPDMAVLQLPMVTWAVRQLNWHLRSEVLCAAWTPLAASTLMAGLPQTVRRRVKGDVRAVLKRQRRLYRSLSRRMRQYWDEPGMPEGV